MSRCAKVLLLGLLAGMLTHPAAWSSEGTLDDEPAPDSVEGLHGPLDQAFRERIHEETLFPRLKRKLQTLPSFFRDTELVLKPRWYYFSRRDLNDDRQNAWTFGGSLAYRSGWWKDFLSVGVEAFSSWKIVARGAKRRILARSVSGWDWYQPEQLRMSTPASIARRTSNPKSS